MGRRTGAKQRSQKQMGLYEFMNKERLAVLSTVTDSGQPRAALMEWPCHHNWKSFSTR
jgi:hypothetical protein